MSIAVSAVIKPSRRLRALLGLFGLAQLAAACAVGLLLPGRFRAAPLLALCFLLAGALLLACCVRATKTRQIDISGLGQIRLTVQQDMQRNGAIDAPVTLMAGTTLWPRLMVLRLRADDGAVTVLTVLPDSVSPQLFRALAVAIAAIGGRDRAVFGTHKIL